MAMCLTKKVGVIAFRDMDDPTSGIRMILEFGFHPHDDGTSITVEFPAGDEELIANQYTIEEFESLIAGNHPDYRPSSEPKTIGYYLKATFKSGVVRPYLFWIPLNPLQPFIAYVCPPTSTEMDAGLEKILNSKA